MPDRGAETASPEVRDRTDSSGSSLRDGQGRRGDADGDQRPGGQADERAGRADGKPKPAAGEKLKHGDGLADRGGGRFERMALLGIRGLIGVVILAVALGITGWLVDTRPEPPRRPMADSGMVVRAITATEVPIARSWEGFATVRARTVAEISAQVSAAVVDRPARVRVGERIESGETLVVLDDSDAEQRLAGAEATVEALEAQLAQLNVELESAQESLRLADESVRLTRREMERLAEATRGQAAAPVEQERLERQLTGALREREVFSQQIELVPVRRRVLEAQLAQQRSSVELAQLDVERSTIVSPIDGIIDAVFVDVGQRLNVGSTVARVVDPTRLEVPLRLPVSAAAELSVGDPVLVRVPSIEGFAWPGTILRFAPQADPGSRTIEVIAEVVQDFPSVNQRRAAGARPALRPGQFVMGRVSRSEAEERVIVPRGAVRDDRVIVMNGEGRAEPRTVLVEQFVSGSWEGIDPIETEWAVLRPMDGQTGVRAGERVVVSNLDAIRPGTRVRSSDATVEESAADDSMGSGS